MLREMESTKIRNGHVLTTSLEVFSAGKFIVVNDLLWIRAVSRERNILDRMVRCEDGRLQRITFPMLDILTGRSGAIEFNGVFSPRELQRRLRELDPEALVVDPREILREKRRFLRQQKVLFSI